MRGCGLHGGHLSWGEQNDGPPESPWHVLGSLQTLAVIVPTSRALVCPNQILDEDLIPPPQRPKMRYKGCVRFPLAKLARLMPVNASPGPLRGRPSRSDLQQTGGRKAGDKGVTASTAQRLSTDRPAANVLRPTDDRSLPAANPEKPRLRQPQATVYLVPSASSLGRRQPVVTTHILRLPQRAKPGCRYRPPQ
jgi:hypothetical protein